jgi:hypothetical protein
MAKKDEYIDPETGKKYKLSDFDDTRRWSRAKNKKTPKDNLQLLPNLLGKT